MKGALDKEGKPAVLTGGVSIGDLFSNIVKSQSLQVDVISGATLTSKVHLKALENALKQADQINH
ncbi:FMN-binding domain protein [compost metagenome]